MGGPMFEKLDALLARYEELTQVISQPEVARDYTRLQACMKEHAELEPIVKEYRDYLRIIRQHQETEELLSDPALAEEARAEMAVLEKEKADRIEKLKLMLIPSDPMDSRNVILEIRAGAGGEEAALFAGDLLRMYLKYCDKARLNPSILSLSDTELGGVNEALVLITGPESYARLKYESGVHCVKRVPVTESGGRIHTSTVTVAVIPEAEEPEIDLKPEDIRVDLYRSSGKGGQHVNTTDSAVRLTHLPTGLVVTCQDERSQLQNKEKAMRVLRSRLLDRMQAEQSASRDAERRDQIGSGERSERIRTYYFNHDYVVDHRIGLTVNRVVNVLNGDLSPFIDALRLAEKTEKLQSLHL